MMPCYSSARTGLGEASMTKDLSAPGQFGIEEAEASIETSETQASAMERRGFFKLGAGLGAGVGGMVVSDLGAGEAGPQRARGATGSIDAHAHWVPDAYGKAITALGKPLTSLHTPMEQDSNLEQRLKWMDEHGVKMHVLTLDGGMPWEWASEDDAVRLAQI